MTDAEYHQQQLEQQEQETTARVSDEYGHEMKLHIWGDDDTVFINVSSNSLYVSVHLTVEQADIMAGLLNNALRRAK